MRDSNIKEMQHNDNLKLRSYCELEIRPAIGTNRTIEEIIHQRFFLIVAFIVTNVSDKTDEMTRGIFCLWPDYRPKILSNSAFV